MADLYQQAIWEADKLRRIEWLRRMGWDQSAIDKMFGIHRTEGATISDLRPFSQSGRSSAPRRIGKPTKPGIESLKDPYRWNNYGQWDLEGKWAPKPPHGSGMSYPGQPGVPTPPPGIQAQMDLARSLGQEVPPYEPPPLSAAQQRLTSRVGPGGVDPRSTHPLAGEFGYGRTIDPNAVDPPATRRQQRRFVKGKGGSKGYGPSYAAGETVSAGKTMGRIQGPESIYHQLKDMPGDKLGRKPSPEMAKMMIQWENMVKGPKTQLAGQLTKFVSKWGMAGIKLMAKLPK